MPSASSSPPNRAAGRASRALSRAALVLGAAARSSLDSLVAVLVAPQCLGCGNVLSSPSGGSVCEACWRSILPMSAPLCPRCGDPRPRPGVCPRCRHVASDITLARAAGVYEDALRRLVHALKYQGRRRLASRLAALMRERGAEVLEGADVLVPVPLHWRRRLMRGFNQAEDLARNLGLPVCGALRRGRATRPQFGLLPAARRRNVHAAFRPSLRVRFLRHALEGKCVVLVDDLATTGATLRECAGVVKALGAREVRALTAARALSPPRQPPR